MARRIDRTEFLKDLEGALAIKDEVAELGRTIATKGIQRVYLIGCGGPNRNMGSIKYWLDHYAGCLEIYQYFPADFLQATPQRLDEHTLVVMATHSGTTPEMLEVADFLESKPVVTVGVTQKADSPFAQKVQHPLLYGISDHGYHAMFMVLLAFLSSLMDAVEKWPFHAAIMTSLENYPATLLESVLDHENIATEDARIYKDDNYMMLIGGGPHFSNAYVMGVCVLMEQQWMRVYPCEAAEFFHGPFEAIDQNTPVVIFMGEDPTRPQAERVLRFCEKFTERIIVYDSKDFPMNGIDPAVRGIFAPYILEGTVERMATHLAVWHNHPLSTRRYMWKFPY